MTLGLILLAAVATPPEPQSPSSGYALIVTNNRSLDPHRPDLQFADDDGAQYAGLFGQLFSEEHVTLLTSFDVASVPLHAHWVQRSAAATRAQLGLAVTRLGEQLSRDHASGRSTVVVLVLAAHGDLDAGTGFIELEDGRLTAAELENEVVARLPADRLHIILDSCNSYFMLSPRKAGGRRWAAPSNPADGLLGRWPSVGAIVSTSAEAVTYEWSELQSGIFSYEVRSGLRGGADADGDQRITYAELAAFISVANRRVPNDLYRPKVFARGPAGDAEAVFLDLRSTIARRLRLGTNEGRRLTVRNGMGMRVADLHTEAGAGGALILPSDPKLSIAESIKPSGSEGRASSRHFEIPDSVEVLQLDTLVADLEPMAQRGDMPVFRSLFEDPFGPRAFAELRDTAAPAGPSVLPQGVTRLDVDRLGGHLAFSADAARFRRTWLGTPFSLVGAASLGAALVPSRVGAQEDSTRIAMGCVGAGLLSAGVAMFFIRDDQEKLMDEFAKLDVSTEATRASSVLMMERRFQQVAEAATRTRRTLGFLSAGLGAALSVTEIVLAARSEATTDPGLHRLEYFGVGIGVASIVMGLARALFQEDPVERAWRFYLQDSRLGEGMTSESRPYITLTPSTGSSIGGTALFGLQGTF